jgi:hypothetical protein
MCHKRIQPAAAAAAAVVAIKELSSVHRTYMPLALAGFELLHNSLENVPCTQ